MLDSKILEQVIGSGISGIMLIIIIVPMFKWFKDTVDKKDIYINKLINEYFDGAEKTRTKLTEAIIKLTEHTEVVPNKIMTLVEKKYPEKHFEQIYKKVIRNK